MSILKKTWNDDGVLLVSYNGDKNDSITIQATANYGTERFIDIYIYSADRGVVIKRTIRQAAGKRSADFNADFNQDFCLSV